MNSLLAALPAPPPGKVGWPWTEGSPPVDAPADGWPSVTIVTPSFNQAQYLEETLRSVLLQGYPRLQHIVMDGGSSDGSREIIARYAPWLDHWQSEPDGGQTAALTAGFERGTGEVFGWLNSDDTFAPGALASLMTLRAAHPETIAWVGAVEELFVDDPKRSPVVTPPRIGDARAMGDWWASARFFQPGCLFSAAAFGAAGGFDARLDYMMDVDLWIRLAQQGPFAATDTLVASAKAHDEMKTRAPRVVRMVEAVYINLKSGQRDIAEKRLRKMIGREVWLAARRRSPRRLLGFLRDRAKDLISEARR